jgi:dihydroflavonol-4-reductase
VKVLVTGASGFFGARLVPTLVERGHEVTTIGRSESIDIFSELPVKHLRADILQPDTLRNAMSGMDVVIHMAGLVSYRKSDYEKLYEANVVGSRNVMEAALAAGVGRVIHMSSIAGMGIPEPGQIGDENMPYNLEGRGLHYCDTKHLSEVEVLKVAEKGLPVLILSPGITLGEGDTHPHHFTIFRSVSNGVMMGYPTGGVMFSDIQDVVNTTVNAMTMGRAGERYVVGSCNLTFQHAAATVSKIIGSKPPVFPFPGFISEFAGNACETLLPMFGKKPPLTRAVAWLSQRNIFFSSEKACRELGHEQTGFDATIRRIAPYYLAAIKGELPPHQALAISKR